jgi:thiamine biosynthesis lipoprotein
MMVRARPLLGTLVTVEVDAPPAAQEAARAVEDALAVMARIAAVMSAHDPLSDLGRIARASPGQVLTVDAHTVTVLEAARHWRRLSGGAFDPLRAGRWLARRGRRPGLPADAVDAAECLGPDAGLEDMRVVSRTQLQFKQPLSLDLGGIAKGYAVDQAIGVLAAHGIGQAIVNAGGDMRVLGEPGFAVDIRHAGHGLREHRLPAVRRLRQGALATSVADAEGTDFVKTDAGARSPWRSATVLARDCMSADALTKWALQSSLLCPRLRAALRAHGARMWRS